MTCLSTAAAEPCHPFCQTPYADCPQPLASGSSNTYEAELPPTIWPSGFVGLGLPYQPQRSNEQDRALNIE